MERYFWHLSPAQADGMACVVCGANFLQSKIASVPVGRSPADESQVFACKDPCAAVIANEAERMAQEMRAVTGTTSTAGVEGGRDDSVFSVDGHFGSLLRDLRVLTGAESLLGVTDDIPTIRFLLSLTARHAETAMMRARLVLARTKENGEA
ncbi:MULTISPECIES: hypothetical protein [Streptomyces]|uniref:hypothetical protein n=1 Tax=Streptomyces TaxID=1883 RepID=UPI00073DBB29|nr:hypothetical protein [Streptomyces sp. EAS-AB2608]MYU29591.1 hypothetical protein [Streptomyces sp. SID7810]BCM69019.1 hypothetical protein EASAB2608_04353 [Streptomyces sp. EAS-AB2608]CUW30650.1 hypothetical protein TUE45_05384 [Streptomyces reticuli]